MNVDGVEFIGVASTQKEAKREAACNAFVALTAEEMNDSVNPLKPNQKEQESVRDSNFNLAPVAEEPSPEPDVIPAYCFAPLITKKQRKRLGKMKENFNSRSKYRMNPINYLVQLKGVEGGCWKWVSLSEEKGQHTVIRKYINRAQCIISHFKM